MLTTAFKKEFKTIFNVVLGSVVIGVGIMFFINPSKFYVGGINGLVQLIVNAVEYFTPNHYLINLGMLAFIFQIPLLILGYLKLSRKFSLYTILSVVIISSFLAMPFSTIVMPGDPLANALAGGILIGLGNGVLFRAGASSGGTSILFQYISLKTGKTVGLYQIIYTAVIISAAGLIFSLPVAVYTIISQIISSLVIDKIHTGYNFMKLEIVTDKGVEMADALAHTLPHGVTLVDATGAYSKLAKTIVYCVISVHEVEQYMAVVKGIDAKAFIVMTGVQKVKGNFLKKIII